MKKVLVCLVVVLVALCLQAQTGKKMSGGVEAAITQMEQQWTAAAKTGDADKVAPLLADNWVTLDSNGTLYNKSESLERMKKSKWDVNEISDVKVTSFGNTAIATGTWRGKGTDNGKPVDATEKWVDTWMKMPSGKWQCIASGNAPLKKM